MIQTVRKIGNSQGILLPKAMLQSLGIEKEVEVELTADGILLKAIRPRHDWEARFKEAQDDTSEEDLFEGMSNDFDEKEWNW
ncbi:AbrB/MazE/SpoVT family DNA-binding domain-containing protein [Siphonobacter sp. SORGH_AS_0500]|uniref:AbrB/MazE/SpoVT family DNA-binding domain-containing protein n=1 Tax=Siphonobacter sp. SORGH_AS_0500 TaxID=1864824 RepID=UPI00285A7E9A|nr:AbrB/MazE/SpoVT family DNA-binding domain-containing protein [Siphonobacter sp. SORGH_AS_0500]MDR6193053.1 antitoxin MazE [Siphonobacter sp. SORGH_AS_0500]